MKIYFNIQDFAELKKDSFLFLDTSALISFVNYEELFADFISQLDARSMALTIIPSIKFEFLRTDSAENQLKRSRFINSHCFTFPIERFLSEFDDLVLIIQKVAGNASYSDFLLYCCLFKYSSKAYLITGNHQDFKTSILDRNCVVTIDDDSSHINNLGIYSLSMSKYEKAAGKILREISQ